jgi:hypothetical protein
MTTKNLAVAASITMLVAISGLASARAAGSLNQFGRHRVQSPLG